MKQTLRISLFTAFVASFAAPGFAQDEKAEGTAPPPPTLLPSEQTPSNEGDAVPSRDPPKSAPSRNVGNRPVDPWSFGLGAGWFFPTDILTPNTASARIRFQRFVTIEPFVNFSLSGSNVHRSFVSSLDDTANNEDTIDGAGYLAALGTAVRVPLVTRGDLDLEIIGAVSASNSSLTTIDDVNFTRVENSTSISGSYGLGIEWFFLEHLSMSADALNPLATWTLSDATTTTQITAVDPVTGDETTGETVEVNQTSSLNIGAIFAPSVRLMFHFYF